MIQSLKLRNFRNFSDAHFFPLEEKNFIIWENGQGKTNILEALSIIFDHSITWLSSENLVKKGEQNLYIEVEDSEVWTLSFAYDQESKKKQYRINWKNISRKKFLDHTYKCVVFSPLQMNLMYLSPGLRRDFLDTILGNSYPEYWELMKQYKKVLKSRNKTLKNIAEWKSQISELDFWTQQFIELSESIYHYRFTLCNYFKKHIHTSLEYFHWKIENIEFHYHSKVQEWTVKNDMQVYLEKNLQRDIILWTTAIGPHVDDFDVLVDDRKLIDFASRGETKSVIIWLKLLETVYLEKRTGKKPLLLIDDLLSELDIWHKNMLIEKIKYYQTFISSIEHLDQNGKIIKL